MIFGGGNRGLAFADVRRAYVLPQNTLSQITQVRRAVPALKALSVIRVWSGIEGYMDDDIPVIGPSAKVPGLFYAFGFAFMFGGLGAVNGGAAAPTLGASTAVLDSMYHFQLFGKTINLIGFKGFFLGPKTSTFNCGSQSSRSPSRAVR